MSCRVTSPAWLLATLLESDKPSAVVVSIAR
jgi:hypothetical protein